MPDDADQAADQWRQRLQRSARADSERTRRRTARSRGKALLAVGSVAWLGALPPLVHTVNSVGYLMGFGQVVNVTVTEGSQAGSTSESTVPGRGHYEHNGERVEVEAYGNAGDTYIARLTVAPDFFFTETHFTDTDHATERLDSACGVAMFGGGSWFCLWAGRRMLRESDGTGQS